MTRPAPTHDTRRARAARDRHPAWGYCYRCGMPWAVVEPHTTNYSEHRGCFPLCDGCWLILGHPEARIVYYGMLLDDWNRQGVEAGVPLTTPAERAAILRAVAAEPVTL